MAPSSIISPNKYYELVDISSGDSIQVWGDSTGGIMFRVNYGSKHHLDEDIVLQTRLLGALLKFYREGQK